jgi:hypothetical protein
MTFLYFAAEMCEPFLSKEVPSNDGVWRIVVLVLVA